MFLRKPERPGFPDLRGKKAGANAGSSTYQAKTDPFQKAVLTTDSINGSADDQATSGLSQFKKMTTVCQLCFQECVPGAAVVYC